MNAGGYTRPKCGRPECSTSTLLRALSASGVDLDNMLDMQDERRSHRAGARSLERRGGRGAC